MIKAFIFDFGGVITRTEDYSPRYSWDERLGLPLGSVERAVHHSDLWIQAQLGRIAPAAYWKGVAELLYMRSADALNELRADYFSGDRLNYKLLGLIDDLRERKYPVALLSNDSIELEDRLRALGLVEKFDHILISAKIGVMKPEATAYRVALQTFGVQPHEAVFLDDSLSNIHSAQAMGIHAVLYRPEIDVRAVFEQRIEDNK